MGIRDLMTGAIASATAGSVRGTMSVPVTDIAGIRKRSSGTNGVSMVGFPTDGGLMAGGVTAETTLGLSSVWRSIDILTNGVSQLEWKEMRGRVELEQQSRLVKRPQSQRTRREWTSLVVATLAMFDVCYLLKAGGNDSEGVPSGLWYIDPTIVMPAEANLFTVAFGLPSDWYYVAGQRMHRDQMVILHRSPLPTVLDTTGGIINLARVTFAAALAAERYASRYWQAGGSPTTVLQTAQRLTKTQTDEASALWAEKKARGPDYAPVLHGGLEAKSFGADPTAQAAVEARREQVADVGRYFGIPTRLLNAPTGDNETYTSTPAANQDLVKFTLQNYIGAIEDAITDLLPGGRRLRLDPSHLTVGTQHEQAQAIQLATGNKPWMLQKEARGFTGLPELDDMSELQPPPPPAPVIAAPGETPARPGDPAAPAAKPEPGGPPKP